MCALSRTHAAEHPTASYRPFDQAHDGLVAGEGGAFVLLERAEDALRRGARIYAEVAGWATTHDGHDPVHPAPDGVRFADAITLAMQRAAITADQLDALFAAGSAVPEEDVTEAMAIRLALGGRAAQVPVTIPKAAFGNLFGAATALDLVIALLSMQHRLLPPTLHLEHPAPYCDLPFVVGKPRDMARLDTIAVNARGIGGTNACIILKRWQEDD